MLIKRTIKAGVKLRASWRIKVQEKTLKIETKELMFLRKVFGVIPASSLSTRFIGGRFE